MNWLSSWLSIMLSLAIALANKTGEDTGRRNAKILSLFEIIRFNNGPCVGNSNQNGTCYTEQECENRGGDNQGTCANGYGICCVFALGCGATSSENCTYFVSQGGEVGDCTLQICRCNDNICQIRLDFNTFTITGPSSSTVVSGVFNAADITEETQCVTDTFSVTSSAGNAPPVICGINTGEHMYVEALDACNTLAFQLSANMGTAGRQWNIKISQYSCDYDNLAPAGCTQYFYGENTGEIQTYNFDGGRHLANQDQRICIRRERGQCRICYFTVDPTDFSVSGVITSMGYATTSNCCAYGLANTNTKYDCVMIPGAIKSTVSEMFAATNICGSTLGTLAGGSTAKTVCTERIPFEVQFLSDGFEFAGAAGETSKDQVGFQLQYQMISC